MEVLIFSVVATLGATLLAAGIVCAATKQRRALTVSLLVAGGLLLLADAGVVLWTLVILVCTGRNGDWIC